MFCRHKLKAVRIANGLSQEQVAAVLGITRSAYCGYEIGRRSPDVDTLINLARFYGLSPNEFFSKPDGADMVEDAGSFDNDGEDKLYLSQLSKSEKDLIIAFRTMSKEEKKELLNELKNKD